MVEFWERFGYYGATAILVLYFIKDLGYEESQSYYLFGAFTAMVYGFVWVGGWLGDVYLGSKRTLILGAAILSCAYLALTFASRDLIFYALAGIVVGNALFKANPAALISKMYVKEDPAFVSAMTFYYVAVNLGALFSMALTPMIMQQIGVSHAFSVSALGLMIGLSLFIYHASALNHLHHDAGRKPLFFRRLGLVLLGCVVAVILIAQCLKHPLWCNKIVYVVVSGVVLYFLKMAFSEEDRARRRMLVALVLIVQSVVFHALYHQLPTSLTLFAAHHVNNHVLGYLISPAQYQVLNPFFIVLLAPLMVYLYARYPATFITKFCVGMTLEALAFLSLVIPQYSGIEGLVSAGWMVLFYALQSAGELLVSGLGLAMVAELCPKDKTGFAMGMWFISTMLAGPLGAAIAALTASTQDSVASLHIYSGVFLKIGLVTGGVVIIMWWMRPMLNRVIQVRSQSLE